MSVDGKNLWWICGLECKGLGCQQSSQQLEVAGWLMYLRVGRSSTFVSLSPESTFTNRETLSRKSESFPIVLSSCLLSPTYRKHYIMLLWEMLLLLGYCQLTPCSIFRWMLRKGEVGEGINSERWIQSSTLFKSQGKQTEQTWWQWLSCSENVRTNILIHLYKMWCKTFCVSSDWLLNHCWLKHNACWDTWRWNTCLSTVNSVIKVNWRERTLIQWYLKIWV